MCAAASRYWYRKNWARLGEVLEMTAFLGIPTEAIVRLACVRLRAIVVIYTRRSTCPL
jgi:hypothetical protein